MNYATTPKQYADDFIKNNPEFGNYSSLEVDSSGKIILKFEPNRFWKIKLETILEDDNAWASLDHVKIELLPNGDLQGVYLEYRGYCNGLMCHSRPVVSTFGFVDKGAGLPRQVGVVRPSIYGATHPQTALNKHLANQAIVEKTGNILAAALSKEAAKAS